MFYLIFPPHHRRSESLRPTSLDDDDLHEEGAQRTRLSPLAARALPFPKTTGPDCAATFLASRE